ncbi:MAG: YceI family protein [Methylotenera sp.]
MVPLVVSMSSYAAEFNQVQATGSGIAFLSKQMGSPVEGRFGKFTANISFDPDNIVASKAQIEIDMASIDVGNRDANDEVKGRDWFNIQKYPTARFISTGIKAISNGRYEATGKLTIKNITRSVTVPFTEKIENSHAVLDGGIPVLRLQYGIGSGEWADPDTVADEVQLRFRFILGLANK